MFTSKESLKNDTESIGGFFSTPRSEFSSASLSKSESIEGVVLDCGDLPAVRLMLVLEFDWTLDFAPLSLASVSEGLFSTAFSRMMGVGLRSSPSILPFLRFFVDVDPLCLFFITSVFKLSGRTTPCNFRNSPQALHSGWPSGFLRHSGVVFVWQFVHEISPSAAELLAEASSKPVPSDAVNGVLELLAVGCLCGGVAKELGVENADAVFAVVGVEISSDFFLRDTVDFLLVWFAAAFLVTLMPLFEFKVESMLVELRDGKLEPAGNLSISSNLSCGFIGDAENDFLCGLELDLKFRKLAGMLGVLFSAFGVFVSNECSGSNILRSPSKSKFKFWFLLCSMDRERSSLPLKL